MPKRPASARFHRRRLYGVARTTAWAGQHHHVCPNQLAKLLLDHKGGQPNTIRFARGASPGTGRPHMCCSQLPLTARALLLPTETADWRSACCYLNSCMPVSS